jgi:CRP/FNR family transcriptional regulator
MLRTVVSLPDGRAATIHYPRPVQLFGLPSVFYPVALSVHVVRAATVVELDAQEVRRCAREFPEFGLFLNRQLAAAVGRVPAIIEAFGFRTVSQRVASHLISLSEPAIVSGERKAHVTQVALADYVGSAREVVSRCLQSLSDEGLVAIGRGWIRITDEAGLQRRAGQS